MSRTPMITLDSDITGWEFGWRPFLPQTEGGADNPPCNFAPTYLQCKLTFNLDDYGLKC